jgi:hypothetical protein
MIPPPRYSVPLLILLAAAAPCYPQSESLIQQEIDSAIEQSLWKLGPFRLSPTFRVDAGYDSNGLSSAQFPEDDIRLRLAPGLRAVSPIKNRALFDFSEEVNFVYYRKIKDLRDVFPVTRVGGAVGGKNVVVRVEDEFREEKLRPTSEFDIPTDQRRNHFDASARMALGWRHEMTVGYRNSRIRILESEAELDEAMLKSRLDRTEHNYRLRLTRHITEKTSSVLEGFYEILDFRDEAAERDADSYGAVAGFTFNPRSNVRGQALLGYKRIIPDVASQADFSGLIGSVDTTMELGQRLRLQVLYSRDAIPSVLTNNWYFVENRIGGSLGILIIQKFSVRPRIVYGRNTYPRPEIIVDGSGETIEVQVEDRFEQYSMSFDYHMTRLWTVSLIVNYLRRDSNFRPFTKDRLTLSFGVRGGVGP